ncbi:MAG TPA: M23 family metallopeptidase [Xanthomonadaceae bacterium]|nr:M23 family metallopeptidase [Xanthomonadaceae bacterium]
MAHEVRSPPQPEGARRPACARGAGMGIVQRLGAVLVMAALVVSAPAVTAKKIYRYVDADGVTHYTDRAPADARDLEVTTLAVRAEQQQLAHLRVDGAGALRRAVAHNDLAGPLQVELRFSEAVNIASEPPLPHRAVLPPMRETVVAELVPIEPARGARFSLELRAVPGDPDAAPEDVVYMLPVDSRSGWRIDQGPGGAFSHGDAQSRHAVDISVPEGTIVRASRGGTVMQVEDDFEGAGLDIERYGSRANHVRVLHSDGTMAVYAHLRPESVPVAPGRRVSVGEKLGESGNTGFSTGPHLHFVIQVNRGMELVSIPFRLSGPEGPIALPEG